ncbi:MAG: hypothetical protein J7K81_03195 [Methanophagales archaeon]|nr:hypothetical protein [Methanophagales archaeon]
MRCQIEKGGYTGNDIAEIAKNIPVSPRALRKRINYWRLSFMQKRDTLVGEESA